MIKKINFNIFAKQNAQKENKVYNQSLPRNFTFTSNVKMNTYKSYYITHPTLKKSTTSSSIISFGNIDKCFSNGDKTDHPKITQHQERSKTTIHTISTTKEETNQLMKGFFANNNPEIEKTLSNVDFSQYGKLGLPLTYSRKEFLSDLSSILDNISKQKKADILTKLSITLIDDNGALEYNGIIDLSQLDSDGAEGEVLSLATRFIKENSISTDDKKLNEILNSLIRGIPEFINIIGKQQQEKQELSIDIHTLTTLKETINNPEYQNLSNRDKFCLKFAIILQDIAKAEAIKDEEHSLISALYAKDILNKFNLPYEIKDRIYELIKNHHWFENCSKKPPLCLNTAGAFRRANDFKIAQIITESNLRSTSTNGDLRKEDKAMLDDLKEHIENTIAIINASGVFFLTSKVINPKKLPTIKHNGTEYKVINFTQLPEDFDLFQFGFEPGTSVENFRIWMHMFHNNKLNNPETLYELQDVNNEKLLCATYGSVKNSKTYDYRKYGVSLEVEQVNIANATNCDQNSDEYRIKKDFKRFKDIILGMDDVSEYRDFIAESIKATLNLTFEEYRDLYPQIQKYKYASQLDNTSEIKIGNKIFTGKQIKEAILKANDSMIIENPRPLDCNEAILYTPKINAIIAKTNTLNDIPQTLLDFAEKYALPIYLLGE
ncbi:MAG: hypothetical protein IKU37_02125 [Candidatus Gastranaerophilales bacterium]|nr:hypothetical protein [Candidatus Gastranaerophilales bacterium]